MKYIITEDQYGQLTESIKLDIKVGDTIMGGKFKNKKVVVKTIGKNDKGDITINGKPLLRFRIIKENIMTESRSKILWLRRRINDTETMDLLKDIVVEGFDYVNPCDYETYLGYETNIVNGSIPTFINSYTELSGDVYVEDNELDEFIRKLIIVKYRGLILREYRDRYCEEDDEDEEEMLTENQNYLLRRVQQFINVVEDMINEYEVQDNPWWCSAFYNPKILLDHIMDRSIEEFVNQNWDFFHDDSEKGGANMDISMLNNIVEGEYGNYIRNMFVRKCNQSRF